MGKVGTVMIWLAYLLGSFDVGFLQIIGDVLAVAVQFGCCWLCVVVGIYALIFGIIA